MRRAAAAHPLISFFNSSSNFVTISFPPPLPLHLIPLPSPLLSFPISLPDRTSHPSSPAPYRYARIRLPLSISRSRDMRTCSSNSNNIAKDRDRACFAFSLPHFRSSARGCVQRALAQRRGPRERESLNGGNRARLCAAHYIPPPVASSPLRKYVSAIYMHIAREREWVCVVCDARYMQPMQGKSMRGWGARAMLSRVHLTALHCIDAYIYASAGRDGWISRRKIFVCSPPYYLCLWIFIYV